MSETKNNTRELENERIDPDKSKVVDELADKLAVEKQDVLDAIEQVGNKPEKIEEQLRGRENSV